MNEAVRPVWDEPAHGYDILSYEVDGTPHYIEVKAAGRSGEKLSFFLTQNEWKRSRALANYFFYLVLDADSSEPTPLAIESTRVTADCLVPRNYFVSIRASGG